MSQYPEYQPPSSPYPYSPDYSTLPVNPRPTSVTTLAIIGIIIGSLSCLCTGPSIFLNAMMLANGGKNPLVPQFPTLDHAYVVFSVFQCVANFSLALILLICSIAALYLKPFARKVIVPWSWATLAWSIILLILTLEWAGPMMEKLVLRLNPNSPMAGAQHIGTIIGAVGTCAVMASLPVCFLIFWTKPHVKAAFREQVGGMPGYYPPSNYPPTQYPPGQYPPGGGQY